MNKKTVELCLENLKIREKQLINLIGLKSLKAERGDVQEARLKQKYENELKEIRYAINDVKKLA